MAGYGGAMSDVAVHPRATGSVELRLRDSLERGDAELGTAAPVLRHLLASDESGLFGDATLARVRGTIGHLAEQLANLSGLGDVSALLGPLTDNSALLRHVHALALEGQLAERLQAAQALDPVLSPLVQALIGSADETTAELAMKFLAAQARFGQAQRRMRLPLTELPGDLLHAALLTMRTVAGTAAEIDARSAAAESRIRGEYDESRSRAGLAARLVSGMGAGAVAALSIGHGGVALFLTALAAASGQDRDTVALSASASQRTRFALALCAAGLAPAAIEEQLLTLDADAALPEGLDCIAPDRAAALLALAGG